MTERKKGSAAVMLVLIAYLLLPLIVTIVYSLFDKWTEIVPHGFSVKSYVELFQDPEFLLCILRSLIVCVVPIVLTTVIILLAMFVTNLYFPKLDKYVQIICRELFFRSAFWQHMCVRIHFCQTVWSCCLVHTVSLSCHTFIRESKTDC